jgi:hypothetical protein
MPIYKSLHNRLSSQHEAIAYIIAHTRFTRLSQHPAPGKWSAQDNIAHLARYQPIFTSRIHSIINSNNPVFERYSADTDSEFESWRQRPLASLLKTIETDRLLLLDAITSLDETQLKRTGTHKKFGTLTVVDWTEFFLLHEAHHIFTIFKLVNDAEWVG